jgi:hypothetical protein
MNTFKLKLILSVLGGIFFAFIFILLTFAMPLSQEESVAVAKPKNKVQAISKSFRERDPF